MQSRVQRACVVHSVVHLSVADWQWAAKVVSAARHRFAARLPDVRAAGAHASALGSCARIFSLLPAHLVKLLVLLPLLHLLLPLRELIFIFEQVQVSAYQLSLQY